jgi:hypothetical protein
MSGAGQPGPVLVVLAAGRARRYGGCKPLAPVGPGGEAVIDLAASDALAAGFGTIVLVIGPSTGPAIRYHVTRTWPAEVDVRFATQPEPLGTVHAVLSAGDELDPGRPFGVANADDLYGRDALAQLAGHLADDDGTSALVGFRLHNAVVGTSPVTRGICQTDDQGRLTALDERRKVRATGDGRFVAEDGREPAELDGEALVSMNLWGFAPGFLTVFQRVMAKAHASEEAEVLLPEVVGDQVADGGAVVTVLPSEGRCIGVTHPDDLGLVQAELAHEVAVGGRPAILWEGSQGGG